ncbi:phage portal protein [Mycolicibacterium mucogenicum]|uniref:Phage portal protein n=1 Tax=Mycolicibacterium mucogenicum TaxID=56689 RepID=A0A4R5WCF7_MYCMU|nr:phage portal protein [Mycolicibacterium mucogenicum]
MDDTFTRLIKALDAPVGRYKMLDAYWYGRQPLAFIAPEQRKALGDRMGRLVANIPRLTVLSIADRLKVQSFDGVDISQEWEANDMPQHSGTLFKEALLLGAAYVLVSTNPDGSPRITVESAKQVTVERDPATRQVTSALKRWETRTTTEATLFLPDRIVRFTANGKGATASAFKQVDEWSNPLGVVPIVPVVNSDRLLDVDGVSEIWDLIPLCDLANKLLCDMAVTSEMTGMPRRWITGMTLGERIVTNADGTPVLDANGLPVREPVNPISEDTYKMAVAASSDARFGQWEAASMAGYESGMRVVMASIGAISSLPPAYLNMTNSQPTSADAVRAQESSLTAKVEAKELAFGPGLEQVAALVVAIRDGVDPASVTARVTWADAASRSVAQEADAAVKLFQAGVLACSTTQRRLGMSDDEIAADRAARRAEALDAQGVTLLTPKPADPATAPASPETAAAA